METQETQDNRNNLRKEERVGRLNTPQCQSLRRRYNSQKLVLTHRSVEWYIEPRNKASHLQLIDFAQGAKTVEQP